MKGFFTLFLCSLLIASPLFAVSGSKVQLSGVRVSLSTVETGIWYDPSASTGGPHWLSAAVTTLYVASTSGSDTGGIYASISYLDSSFLVHTKTAVLTGQTRVAITFSPTCYRINEMTTGGSSTANVGIISLANCTFTSGVADDNTKVYRVIPAGFGHDADCFYTVPAGKTLYITNLDIDGDSSQISSFLLWQKTTGTYKIPSVVKSMITKSFAHYNYNAVSPLDYNTAIPISAGTDLWVTGQTASSTMNCTVNIDAILK